MVIRRFLLLVAVVLSVHVFLVQASIEGTGSALPANGSFLAGEETVEISFLGNANITIEFNSSAGYQHLNTTFDASSPYLFDWQTANGSFPDGPYAMRITLTNASNASDEDVIHVSGLTIDNTLPHITLISPDGGRYGNGQDILVNATVVEENIDDGTACFPFIDGGNGTFTGTVTYDISRGWCNGTITLSGISDGAHSLTVNVTDRAGNTNASSPVTIVTDSTAPLLSGMQFVPNNPASGTTSVNITVNATDASNISAIVIGNGTHNLSMVRIGGLSSDGIYSRILNLSDLNCPDEGLCSLAVAANDTLGNTNDSLGTNDAQPFLYIDSRPPLLLTNATNASVAGIGDNVTISASWDDVALNDPDGYTVLAEFYDEDIDSWSGERFQEWSHALLDANYTNVTFWTNGSDEGRTLVFRITLNDSWQRSNMTANLSVAVGDFPPIIGFGPSQNEILDEGAIVLLTANETGIGLNLSSLAIDAISSTNTTVTYQDNSSLFSCTETAGIFGGSAACNLSTAWLLGNVTLEVTISDRYGNSNTSNLSLFIAELPDIVNVSINGQAVAGTTPDASVSASVANGSREILFNWSVESNRPIDRTTIAFGNVTDPIPETRTALPAIARYNVTAGKNYLVINATLEGAGVQDEVQINLTANVPLNVSAIGEQYVRGMVDGWRAVAGTELSGERLINETLDLIVNVTNTSGQIPYRAIFNYTGLSGLSLRWNATDDAFRIIGGGGHENLSNLVRANVTSILEHRGQTSLFFDGNPYLLKIEVNLTGMDAYYQKNNGTENTYLLTACSTTPSDPVGAGESCYVASGNATVLYVERFEQDDRLFFAQEPYSSPNITITTSTVINQSVIPVEFQVVTPSPNSSFCTYDIGKFNATSGVSTTQVERDLVPANFTLEGIAYGFSEDVGWYLNGQYNLTITCADDTGGAATAQLNFNISDTTPPIILSTSISASLQEATIGASADEPATFTVAYGTGALNTSVSGGSATLSDNITLEGLAENTRYSFNVTACDPNGQCSSSATDSFRTTEASDSSSSGGGGGGAGGTEQNVDAISNRFWFNLKNGETLEFTIPDMALSRIAMVFSNDVPYAQITIEQFSGKPAGLPSPPGMTYKYFQVRGSGLDGNVERYDATFRVPDAWLDENGILPGDVVMYRLEGGWVPYGPDSVLAEEIATYTVSLPGFSYLAIGSRPQEPDQQQETPQIPPDPMPDAPAGEPEREEPSGDFVSALEQEGGGGSIKPILMILLFVALAGVFVVFGLQAYKFVQGRQQTHEHQIRMERAEYEQKKHPDDPLVQLRGYVVRMRRKGVPDDDIRKRLSSVGWDEIVVDQEMERI